MECVSLKPGFALLRAEGIHNVANRVFFTYNYFGNLRGPANGSGNPLTSTQTTPGPIGAAPTQIVTFIPGEPSPPTRT